MRKTIKIATICVGVIGVAYCTSELNEQVKKDIKEMSRWPTDRSGNRVNYCDLLNYRSCTEDQWFGILRSPKLDKHNGRITVAINGIIDAVCKAGSDPPSSSDFRLIERDDGLNLVMCRLRDPETIDRGKVLMHAEDTHYWGRL